MKKSLLLNILILVTLSIIWGTSFILIKKGLESFTSFQIANLRVFISFLFLLPIAIKNIKKINRKNLLSLIVIGFLGSGIPALLYPIAQTRIDSSVAGMLNSLTPVFTLLIGIFFFRRKAISIQVLGIFIGCVGAVGLMYKGGFSFNHYGALIVLATLFYGISSNHVAQIKEINGITITSLAFLFVGPIAGVNLIFSDFSVAAETENFVRNLAYIGVLSVFGSGVALAIFNILILRTSPVFATSVTYLIPIVATFWGVIDGEIITSSIIISVNVIMIGVFLATKKKSVKKM